jgi:hypothetical protein
MLCHVEIISLSQGHIENYVIVKAWLDPRATIASSSIPSTQASFREEPWLVASDNDILS